MQNLTDAEAQTQLDALLAEAEESTQVDFESLDDDTLRAQLKRWADLRALYDKAKALKNTLEKAEEELGEKLATVLEAKGIKSIRLEGIGLFGTSTNSNPKVANEEALFKWLKDKGEDGIIKSTIHYMTLKSFLNQRKDDGKEIPGTDIVELTPRQTMRLTREKPKSSK